MIKSLNKNLEYYKNLAYTIIIEKWDDGNGSYWVARVLELPHCIIHGNTPEEAVTNIEDVKMEWIESNLEDGLPIPEPEPKSHEYSGQIRLRIPPSLHRQLSYKAAIEDVSLNQYMTAALAKSVGQVEERDNLESKKVINMNINYPSPDAILQRAMFLVKANKIVTYQAFGDLFPTEIIREGGHWQYYILNTLVQQYKWTRHTNKQRKDWWGHCDFPASEKSQTHFHPPKVL